MPGQKNRVIIDTNLWISFLLSDKLLPLDKIISHHEIELIFSLELIDELVEVTQRPRFRKYFPIAYVQTLLEKLQARSTTIKVTSEIEICRDPEDNFLLALAKDSDAHFLLTGDNDLLVMGSFGNTKIITFIDFMKVHFK